MEGASVRADKADTARAADRGGYDEREEWQPAGVSAGREFVMMRRGGAGG